MYIASIAGIHLPSNVALLLTLAFIVFLFRRDIRERPNVSNALWLPLIWLVLDCSRSVSAWLKIFGLPVSGAISVEEGSPIDALFYVALMFAGVCVLNKRRVRLAQVIQNNGWLMFFLFYCFVAIAWSDFPFVAFKRWIKVFGHPVMALIVLTEPDLKEALIRLMKRCAYIVAPVSILFIKYFPNLGRSYDQWTGQGMNNGIAIGKNLLGADCLILGFFFFWYLLQTWRTEQSRQRRKELFLIGGFLLMIMWLLRQAHSATAWIALFIGALTVVAVGFGSVRKRIGAYLLSALILIAAAELTFGISGVVSEALGRKSTLSGRTELWKTLLGLHTNPVFGTGFDSFWLGERAERLAEIYWWHPNEAHNGYLEVYLNLGIFGLSILIGLIMATFWKIRPDLDRNFEWGRYRLGFFAAIVLSNWTEAAIRTYHPAWFVFYIIAMEYPRFHLPRTEWSSTVEEPKEAGDLAFAGGTGVAVERYLPRNYRVHGIPLQSQHL